MPATFPSHVTRLWLILLVLFLAGGDASAHPEDEFCAPGDTSLDPALCEQLMAMDSADGKTARLAGPILDAAGKERGFWSTLGLYVGIGVGHILPGGLDHILFVVALFLSSRRMRALVIQISTFTVAHTVTLGIAAAGVITPPAAVIEPLIALTIALVAIENLFITNLPPWRPLVVFAFGLLHGLGYAGYFGELGLPPGQFWSALIGFNIGVEFGQLGIVAVAAVMLVLWRRWSGVTSPEQAYRRWVVVPASSIVGVIGCSWFVERTFML